MHRARVRAGFGLASEVVGLLEPGSVVNIVAVRFHR